MIFRKSRKKRKMTFFNPKIKLSYVKFIQIGKRRKLDTVCKAEKTQLHIYGMYSDGWDQ